MTPLQAVRLERRRRYWLDPPRRVRDVRSAARFIDAVGFAFVFRQPRTELPALLDAHSGGGVRFGWNEETGHVWDWKDELAERRLAAFGRYFRTKASLVAPRLVPALYATGHNYGDLDDAEEAYHGGRIGPGARRIAQILAAEGPLTTARLRQRAAVGTAYRFHRAMQELYESFKITNVGISTADSRWPAAVVDLMPRAFPAEARAGAALSPEEGRARVVRAYLEATVACTPQQAARVLGWRMVEVREAFEALLARGEAVPWSPGKVPEGSYADPAFVGRAESLMAVPSRARAR